ncbi:MAG: hypothetical protein QG608_3855, partial [Actinomycetota bacterium]|nr:hypothetical protein [Actinomycetota bacterium]
DAGSTTKGYSVRVVFTGDVKGTAGGSGTVTKQIPVPVRCWWAPASSFYDDPAAMYTWYQGRLNAGSTSDYALDHFGTAEQYEQAIERSRTGHKPYWYLATCKDPADLPGFTGDHDGPITRMRVFEAAEGTPGSPTPTVEPDQLALAAYNELELTEPTIDRNPKATTRTGNDGLNAGWTLVNIPTWFWVTDPRALGDKNGKLSVTARIPNTGPSVTLTARNNGLHLESDEQNTTCDIDRATLPWKPGLSDDQGCTLQFLRSSAGHPGGRDVTARVTWKATWTTTGDNTPHPLNESPKTTTHTTRVPIAEIQAIVSDLK